MREYGGDLNEHRRFLCSFKTNCVNIAVIYVLCL